MGGSKLQSGEMKCRNCFLVMVGSLALSQAASAALLIDFNAAGQFANNFSTSQSTGLVTQSASGGLGNTGHIDLSGLSLESGQTQIWTLNTSFNPTLSNWSAEFYLKGSVFANFGVTTQAAPNNVESYPVNGTATAYLPQISMGTGGNLVGIFDENNVVASDTVTVPLANGWYRYQLSVSYLGEGNYNVTATVHTADANGALLQQIGTLTTPIHNPELAAAPQAYIYLGIDRVGESIDNFYTTIPEPASASLALMGTALLVLRRRR